MDNYEKYAAQVILAAKNMESTAIKYVNEYYTIKATRRSADHRRVIMIVTMGKPNYAERRFIKLAKLAGESFPIKKIQLKPVKKAKK